MRLYLADGNIQDIRPGATVPGAVIVRFEMTADDITSAWNKTSLTQWLLAEIFPRMGRAEKN